MKKTLISLLVISSLASAVNVDLNLEPLKDSTADRWTKGHNNSGKSVNPTLDHTQGTLTYTSGNWSQGYAVYTLGSPITLKTTEDTLTFSMTIQTTSTDSLILGTLMGDSKSLTFGHGEYSHSTKLQMGTSTVIDGTFYNMQTNDNGTHPSGTFVEDAATSADGVWEANTAITLTSKIAWSEEANGFVATVTYGEGDGTHIGTTGSLGQTFSLSKLSFSTDGSSSSVQTVSNVQLSAHLVPEPATATLSLLALVGLAARRRRK